MGPRVPWYTCTYCITGTHGGHGSQLREGACRATHTYTLASALTPLPLPQRRGLPRATTQVRACVRTYVPTGGTRQHVLCKGVWTIPNGTRVRTDRFWLTDLVCVRVAGRVGERGCLPGRRAAARRAAVAGQARNVETTGGHTTSFGGIMAIALQRARTN
jgi:hypothetical protein